MLEKICTDLETSKKLKELGFNDSESEFVYWKGKPHYYHNLPFYEVDKIQDLISCFTLEQIINELPKYFNFKRLCYYFSINYSDDALEYKYESDDMYQSDRTLFFTLINKNNLATTAAKLWIKLKEDKIIT